MCCQKLLDPAEAAEYARISLHTLNHERKHGRGPDFVRINRRTLRYRKADIDRWIEGRVVSNAPWEIEEGAT